LNPTEAPVFEIDPKTFLDRAEFLDVAGAAWRASGSL
jgi:hypothetical protein